MPNQFSRQITNDGPRNANVAIVGMLSDSDANLVPAVALSDFVANDTRMTRFYGLAVYTITYSIGDGIQLELYWQATQPQLIAAIAGRGELSFSGGLIPNRLAIGYTGDILLTSTGYNTQGVPPQNFTINLAMVKLYIP